MITEASISRTQWFDDGYTCLTGSTQQINASVQMLVTLSNQYGCWFHCIDLLPTSEVVAFLTAGVGGPTQ